MVKCVAEEEAPAAAAATS